MFFSIKIYLVPAILIIILSSCSKGSLESDTSRKESYFVDFNQMKSGSAAPNDAVHIEINHGSITNTFEGQGLDGLFNYQRKGGVNNFTRTIMIDTAEFAGAEISNIDKNSFTLEVDSMEILAYDVIVSGDTLFLKAKLPLSTHTVYFKGYDPNGELAGIMDDFRTGGEIEQRVWPIIFGAACLIGALVDAYCGQQIANDVANCAANCQGASVGSCGADCVDVCS